MSMKLIFPDHKVNGRFAVTDESGTLVADLEVSYLRASFIGRTSHDELLCSGRRRGAFNRTIDLLDASETVLATIKPGWAMKVHIELPGGRQVSVTGEFLRRNWIASDADGGGVLTAVQQAPRFTLHPDSYAVTCHDDTLNLATFVGVVEAVRLMHKRRRGSAAGAGTAGSG